MSFKSAIPNIIPSLATLYEKANDILNAQYCTSYRAIVPENQWIFENNLEYFTLNIENIDRVYFYYNNLSCNKSKYSELYVRIKLDNNKIFYVIISQYDLLKNNNNSNPDFGWILITPNPYIFVKYFYEHAKLTQKDFILQFLYENDNVEKYVDYHQQHSSYVVVESSYNNNNNYNNFYYSNIKDGLTGLLKIFPIPQCLNLSMNKTVITRDFGFYTFYFSKIFYSSHIFNKFYDIIIAKAECIYIKRMLKNNNNNNNKQLHFHPHFKSVVTPIISYTDFFVIRNIINKQYCQYGRTTIPQYKWIYENNLEFFKLNIKDIDRLYLCNGKKLLCVRVILERQFFYVIYIEERGIIYITSNPQLFIEHLISLSSKRAIYLIRQSLYNDGQLPLPISLSDICHKVIYQNKIKLQSQFPYLPHIVKKRLDKFIACKEDLIQYKFDYFEYSWYKSRVLNKFDNDKFLVDANTSFYY